MNQDPFPNSNPAPQDMHPVGKSPRKFRFLLLLAAIALVVIFLLFDSVFMLNSGEEAVITRFGQYQNTVTTPGLQLKLPLIERRYTVNVESIQRLEFGFQTETQTEIPEEASMLTGDENLVIADWAILYRIKNSYNYLFNVQDPIGTLRVISESSYRRVVASHPLDDILTNQKDAIQIEVMNDLQEIVEKYKLGIVISAVQLQDAMPPNEVKEAFLEVSSAKEQKNAKINQASQYENEQLPMARGEAAKLINAAEAYKAQRINEAMGAVSRYTAIETEYTKQPNIMRTRLYIEMIRDVLPKVKNVYIVDENDNTLQFLPLTGETKLAGGN